MSIALNEVCRVLVPGSPPTRTRYETVVCIATNKKKDTIEVRAANGSTRHVALSDVWKKKVGKKKGNVGCMHLEKLPTRNGRYRRRVTVQPTYFNRHPPGNGNFSLMLKMPRYQLDGVMGFNDNLRQFLRFLNTRAEDFAGGGNACARPYQHIGDSIGVPTGPFTSLDEEHVVMFPEDTDERRATSKEIIDRAFVQIHELFLARPDKTVLYYSADHTNEEDPNTKRIGLGIFANMVGDDVITYITKKLHEVPDDVQKARFA